MDVIRLHNMTFYGYHGISSAERQTGRRFEVDVELMVDLNKPARTDRLRDTINYTEVYKTVEELVEQNSFSLLETIAVRLADQILTRFKPRQVTVRVRKKIPPVPGNLDHIEVEITRERKRAGSRKIK
jgi:dihydroneopterin aldolase